MPRPKRASPPGVVCHVLNRSAKKSRLFVADSDYEAFLRVLALAVDRFNVALFAYCVMPNHWHLLLSPKATRELSRFMHWVTTTHARRWQLACDADGLGAVYQGRFKSIPIEAERHFLWACRYVERNALRANLVERAENWRWSSLWQRQNNDCGPCLAPWPILIPDNWLEHVNSPQTFAELEAFRRALNLGQPFGGDEWAKDVVGVNTSPARMRGRPRKCPRKMTSDPLFTDT